jgi:hypothetical protein
MSAVPAATAAVDDRRAINRYSNARPPAPYVKAPARSGRSASRADPVSRTFDEFEAFQTWTGSGFRAFR